MTFPAGTTALTPFEIISPTPALVKTAPKQANSIGNVLRGPTVSNISAASSKNTFGVLFLEKNIMMKIATKTPTPTPTKAPKVFFRR